MKNLFNAGFGYGRIFPLKTKKLMNTVKNYFRFVAVEDSSILLSGMDLDTGPDNTVDLQYSKDGSTWTQYDFNPIPLNAGETLYMKGNNPNGFSTPEMDPFEQLEPISGRIYVFGNAFGNGTTGKYECLGNIMSLLYGDEFEDKTIIPNTGCFMSLFAMCSGLLTAPELPATTLAERCYGYMFYDCESLVTAPKLPATTLAERCYHAMFGGCSKLNNITMLATDINATHCLTGWVEDVASTGTFTKASSMTLLPTGDNGIPSGWDVQDYIA